MRVLRLLATAVILGLLLIGGLAFDGYRQLHEPLRLDAQQPFEIAPGAALATVIEQLRQEHLLPSARAGTWLRLYARWQGLGGRIRSGEYLLDPGQNLLSTIELFMSGRVLLHELRFVEGWSFAQALQALRSNPAIKQTMPDATPEALMAAIGQPGLHPEGRFFPDTYRYPKGTADIALLQQAFAAMQAAAQAEWAQRAADLPYANIDEALTMASIIEKETGAPVERAQIAGVFVRRLRLGMRLQTDPTVIYGVGARFDGNLRKTDLLTDTPYNTYQRAGLPPTPICLPGRAALHAALHPDDGKALFFVSKGDGTHVFSETLAEHEAAVRRYQLKRP